MLPATGATGRGLLNRAIARLAEAGIGTAGVEAEWLLAGVLGVRRFDLYPALARELDAGLAAHFDDAVSRRARREPLQRILGWEEFRGLRFVLTPAVLVPRPETEMLVEWTLTLLPPPARSRRPLVVDVGTGSGCIACALAHERPDVDLIATDTSLAALGLARSNAHRLGLEGRIRPVASDLLAAIGSTKADLIVSNPPYLPTDLLSELTPEVRDHEPRAALDGGADGLRDLRRLVAEARRVLRPSGALVLETAGGAQAAEVSALARAAGLAEVTVRRDLAGIERFVAARMSAETIAEAA
ncbi:MAG: protein-(glutamine-N5) methyltransferase, release factor-specific [Candidatus Rokubacteria bacterium 13_1_40CM_4_69_5]|nr:MAG: protein-(glutamine-N5) methyltransferase, release factor-specific [Candidatus Rokubacteria bacterium 13_1_40CM_4_69_5]